MTAIPNKVTRVTILVTRVSKVDREANPEHAAVTWETRVNKAVQAAAASKGSKEVRQIAEVSKVNKVKKEEFLPIVALLRH